MPSEYFRVQVTSGAKDDLRRIGKRYGKKAYETVRDLICDLDFEPEKKGEPLQGSLRGLYSRHYSRFRIIYSIERGELVVLVIGAGHHTTGARRDIYKLIEQAIKKRALVMQDELSSGATGSIDND